MKLTFKLVKQDLKYQTCRKWYYFIPVMLLVIYMCIQAKGDMELAGEAEDAFSFGGYLSNVFRGTIEYIPDIHPFEVRPDFMLIHVIMAYMIAYYPVRDLQLRGHQILIRAGRMQYWWYAKCIWTVINITVYYLVIFLMVLFYSGNVRIIPNTVFYLLILPYLTSLMLSLLQITVSLVTAPIYGFMAVVFLLLLSTYFFSEILPGNFLMTNRMAIAREGGVTFGKSALICLAVMLLCFVAGRLYIKRKDMIG